MLIGVVFAGALICSRYWFRVMWIHGDSMYPTYHDCQLVLLDVRERDYSYGDIIAFDCPALQSVLVKRIVGCPGDRIKIYDGRLYRNGEISVSPIHSAIDYAGIAEREIVLGQEEYFVLGDNVAESRDSRYEEVGAVGKAQIIGCVLQIQAQLG